MRKESLIALAFVLESYTEYMLENPPSPEAPSTPTTTTAREETPPI